MGIYLWSENSAKLTLLLYYYYIRNIVHILNIFLTYSRQKFINGHIFNIHWKNITLLSNILDAFFTSIDIHWTYNGYIFNIVIGHKINICWIYVGHLFDISRTYIRNILDIHYTYIEHVFTNIKYIFGEYWTNI